MCRTYRVWFPPIHTYPVHFVLPPPSPLSSSFDPPLFLLIFFVRDHDSWSCPNINLRVHALLPPGWKIEFLQGEIMQYNPGNSTWFWVNMTVPPNLTPGMLLIFMFSLSLALLLIFYKETISFRSTEERYMMSSCTASTPPTPCTRARRGPSRSLPPLLHLPSSLLVKRSLRRSPWRTQTHCSARAY